jgi:hypothetical protein
VVTAPGELRERLQDLSDRKLVRTCAAFRPGAVAGPSEATKTALRSLARRYMALREEVRALDQDLERLTHEACPPLLDIFGAGSDTAGALLLAAGDNPERLRSEAAFAKLCGASPVEASSGKTTRHRLNRGGDRHANAALYPPIDSWLLPSPIRWAKAPQGEAIGPNESFRPLQSERTFGALQAHSSRPVPTNVAVGRTAGGAAGVPRSASHAGRHSLLYPISLRSGSSRQQSTHIGS